MLTRKSRFEYRYCWETSIIKLETSAAFINLQLKKKTIIIEKKKLVTEL